MSDGSVKLGFIQHLINFHLTFTGMCEVLYHAVIFMYNHSYSKNKVNNLVIFFFNWELIVTEQTVNSGYVNKCCCDVSNNF